MHRIKLAVLSSLILVAVVACGSEMPAEASAPASAPINPFSLGSKRGQQAPPGSGTLIEVPYKNDNTDSQEMPADDGRRTPSCITALAYLVQDHTHPVTVRTGYEDGLAKLGIGDADKAFIGDEARVDEIISTHCATFIDTRLLSELRAWPKENLIQSGPRKGNRRQ